MWLSHELRSFTIPRAIFLYKTANEDQWTRLQSPIDGSKYNCHDISFDRGVFISQKYHATICSIELVLKPPTIKTENDQITVEAACVAVGNPRFLVSYTCKNKEKAVHQVEFETLPLALLDKNITLVRLMFDEGRGATEKVDSHELGKWIRASIDHGYHAMGAEQTNASGLGQTKKLCTVPPGPSNDSSEVSAAKPTLEQRLQVHEWKAEQGELHLRQVFEEERQSMLGRIKLTIDHESERRLAATVLMYRAGITSKKDRILAKWGNSE